jgi:SNF1-activating kinase 1
MHAAGGGEGGGLQPLMCKEAGVVRAQAMKIMRKRADKPRFRGLHQADPQQSVNREIAVLKKCSHPNIVQLIEVIDNPELKKVYLSTCHRHTQRASAHARRHTHAYPPGRRAHRMTESEGWGRSAVLQYMDGGEVEWARPEGGPAMSEAQARSCFRDVLLGLEYRTTTPAAPREVGGPQAHG